MNSIKTRLMDYKAALRNIPTAFPRKHLFNEEINTGLEQDRLLDWANTTSGIVHERSSSKESKDIWYKYGSLERIDEFLFDRVDIPKSRFSDGSYPLWYGAEDIVTSLSEIEFHLKRDVIFEIGEGKIKHIVFERAMCEADLTLKNNFDVKYLKNTILNYHEVASYDECIVEFIKLKKMGVSSITFSSARSQNKECYAVSEKEEINSSKVIKFFKMIVYSDTAKETEISEIILKE